MTSPSRRIMTGSTVVTGPIRFLRGCCLTTVGTPAWLRAAKIWEKIGLIWLLPVAIQ